MKLVVKQKSDASDKSPLIIQWVDQDKDGNPIAKHTKEVKIGETFEVGEEQAYQLLAKYRGCLAIVGSAAVNAPQVQGRSLKGYADKAMPAQVQTAEG